VFLCAHANTYDDDPGSIGHVQVGEMLMYAPSDSDHQTLTFELTAGNSAENLCLHAPGDERCSDNG
jgi:hypothetical protein